MMATKDTKIVLRQIQIQTMRFKVIGKSPYLPEPMDDSVLDMYDKKKSKQTYEKDTRSEDDKLKQKFYFTETGGYGIPARAFYNSVIRVSSYFFTKDEGGMRNVREGLTVIGDILPLEYSKVSVLKHWGRMSGKSKAPRKILRNAFYDWSTVLEVQYNTSQLSKDQVWNLFSWAGFHIGVGGFRKEKSGNFGQFEIVPCK